MSSAAVPAVGLCLAAYSTLGLPAALGHAATLGDLWLDLPTDTTLGLVDARRCHDDARYRDDVASILAGTRVGVVSNSRDGQLLLGPHGPYAGPLATGSPQEQRAHAVTCALGAIRLAAHLRVPAVRLLVGCPDPALWLSWPGVASGWQHNVEQFFEHAAPILRAARAEGIRILLEPHPKQIIYDRASAELVLDAAHADGDVLDLCIDPANLAAMGHDPVLAVTGWGERLAAVHAKDLQRARGARPPAGPGWSRYGPQPAIRFRALGCGELDWPAVVAALLDEGFGGVVYVEHEDVLLPRAQSVARGVELLRSLLPADRPEGRTW
ncbi:sugar phosphate isomerase/epimerase family protein [Dactylosporangium sp. NPDC048998]|uniref:sugar phosphate isomerase/epimerase family protein n=1 Tax=Dactylosporangium sp. NPDC048998 TaxID=3363976 RepID=UPI0037160CD9